MNQKAIVVRTEQWRQIIYNCVNHSLELSQKQWCQNNRITYRSLMYWQHKFQMESLDPVDIFSVCEYLRTPTREDTDWCYDDYICLDQYEITLRL